MAVARGRAQRRVHERGKHALLVLLLQLQRHQRIQVDGGVLRWAPRRAAITLRGGACPPDSVLLLLLLLLPLAALCRRWLLRALAGSFVLLLTTRCGDGRRR